MKNRLTKIIQKLLCKVNMHNYEISNHGVGIENDHWSWKYHRECLCCGHRQNLERPKKYHPTKSVWVDV